MWNTRSWNIWKVCRGSRSYLCVFIYGYCHTFVDCVTDRFYVPLLRSTDNTLAPVISGPWCPSEFGDRLREPIVTGGPKNPNMTIKAFVGPLTFSKVNQISGCLACVRSYRKINRVFLTGRGVSQTVEDTAAGQSRIFPSYFKIWLGSGSRESGQVTQSWSGGIWRNVLYSGSQQIV